MQADRKGQAIRTRRRGYCPRAQATKETKDTKGGAAGLCGQELGLRFQGSAPVRGLSQDVAP